MKKQTLLQTAVAAFMAVFATIMMSSTAMAHPGHSHAANESMLMHVLFYGSIATAIAAIVWVAYRQLSKQNSK